MRHIGLLKVFLASCLALMLFTNNASAQLSGEDGGRPSFSLGFNGGVNYPFSYYSSDVGFSGGANAKVAELTPTPSAN
jgi:hypothetical protein